MILPARPGPGLCVLAVVMLAGCAARPPAPDVGWDERRTRLLGLDRWAAKGRIAVKSPDGGGQGNLQWRQAGASARIRLSGPFGAGAYELAWDLETLTVTDKDGAVAVAYTGPDSAQRFLDDQLGWSFPATSTRYWILGLLDPGYPGEESFDQDGRLAGLEQNGWSVSYERFSHEDELLLPRKMSMENGSARVRLVIDKWDL